MEHEVPASEPDRTDLPPPEEWPPPELVDRFVPAFDFHFMLGEDTILPADDPKAVAEARHFRDVLGRFATGVTVVTSMSHGEPVGMTCQSFSSVSLVPPLVLFCPSRSARAWPLMRQAGFFCVNLLARDQEWISQAMASKGDDKYAGVGWSPSKTGAPLIDGVLGYVDCTVHAVYEAGDHYVVIGRVQDLGVGDASGGRPSDDALPLTFFRGRYGTHQDD